MYGLILRKFDCRPHLTVGILPGGGSSQDLPRSYVPFVTDLQTFSFSLVLSRNISPLKWSPVRCAAGVAFHDLPLFYRRVVSYCFRKFRSLGSFVAFIDFGAFLFRLLTKIQLAGCPTGNISVLELTRRLRPVS